MKRILPFAGALVAATVMLAAERGTLLFEDHFDRDESQATTDEVGNGWTTNSKARAGGHKQVDLRAGAMYISIHPEADHAVSVAHTAEFRDGVVELRFMLENDQDTLGLDFADPACKEVHAGHLFKVDIGTKRLDISDLKFGTMNLAIQKLKEENQLSAEQKKSLAAKKQSVPVKLETGKWYALKVEIAGNAVSASLDGKAVNTFSSEAFAHPTKRLLRLAVPHQAVVDDIKVVALAPVK